MKHCLFTVSLIFFLVCCRDRNKNIIDKDSMYVDKILVDTVHANGVRFIFRIRVDNNTNKDIHLYTGLRITDDSTTQGGFFIYCKKINTSYELITPAENSQFAIPARTMGKKILSTTGFIPFSSYASKKSEIALNYYTNKNRAENIKNFLSDIEIVYRVDKSKMDNNEDSLKVPIQNNIIINYYRRDKTLDDVQQTLED